MREVDFLYLRSALESLNSSTDLVLARGQVQVVLSHQCSPYLSRRQVNFGVVSQPLGDDVLLATNYRKVLVVGRTEGDVRQATEGIGRDGRPFEDSQLGWDGPWADWCIEPVPSGMRQLRGLIQVAHEYGLVDYDWMTLPLLHVAWLVPVVMEWDEDGRPVFSWPERFTEPESEPMGQGLPVEACPRPTLSEPHTPLNAPPGRFAPPQLYPGLQRPAGQRSQDTHGQTAAQRQTGCGVSDAGEGDYDFGAAKSLTRPTTPWALSRSSVASTMSSTYRRMSPTVSARAMRASASSWARI